MRILVFDNNVFSAFKEEVSNRRFGTRYKRTAVKDLIKWFKLSTLAVFKCTLLYTIMCLPIT